MVVLQTIGGQCTHEYSAHNGLAEHHPEQRPLLFFPAGKEWHGSSDLQEFHLQSDRAECSHKELQQVIYVRPDVERSDRNMFILGTNRSIFSLDQYAASILSGNGYATVHFLLSFRPNGQWNTAKTKLLPKSLGSFYQLFLSDSLKMIVILLRMFH